MENDFDVPVSHWLRGSSSNYSMVATRIELDQIPTDPVESKQFLNELFQEKDRLLDLMIANPKAESFMIEGSKFYNKIMRKRPFSKETYYRWVVSRCETTMKCIISDSLNQTRNCKN